MKQADLGIGSDYAFLTYQPYDGAPLAARVRIVSIDGQGKVTVRVMDPGPKLPKNAWGARPVKQNEQQQITTRKIVCPWDEWADRSAAIGAENERKIAERRTRYDDFERRLADRLVLDPERVLPTEYDEDYFSPDTDAEERTALSQQYIPARGLGPYATLEEIRPLLVDLPVPVLRDVLATDARRRPGRAGTVAATFLRAAELLEVSRIASMRHAGRTSQEIPRPERLLDDRDIAFVNAVRDQIAAAGGELLLPPVPVLPDWVDEDDRTTAPVFGWLRLAVADTSGRLLHSPGCRSVRSYPVQLADHVPWWLVMLEHPRQLCAICGGPAVRDLVAMAGFVAAVDVWHARGCDKIERWQQTALQRLLSATALARAEAQEPDITLAWRIVAALRENSPGERGWAAYTLVAANGWNRLEQEIEKLPQAQREEARVVARDRLNVLGAALPTSHHTPPLPETADVHMIRQRYQHLKDLLQDTAPQLDRLLFTLPGAR
ncbi:hypothetical protein LZ318_28975 [Saccharopolyspora indica]|uniref:hypothetical protein n=1 Tax=Saccharopolyspora indica TaxID=1229659 RepID=UPI0022EA66B5|nr:hypothetical protein [Saccharopolyspora indica]MDA3646282.1 hypothetical protein [Saccharopolyspora indica]